MKTMSLDYRVSNVVNKTKFYSPKLPAYCRTPVLSDDRSDNIDISCFNMYFLSLKYSVQR